MLSSAPSPPCAAIHNAAAERAPIPDELRDRILDCARTKLAPLIADTSCQDDPQHMNSFSGIVNDGCADLQLDAIMSGKVRTADIEAMRNIEYGPIREGIEAKLKDCGRPGTVGFDGQGPYIRH